MLKFRKMHDDAEGPALTTKGDERFTRFGRFLASSKLDEVPQLWNVVKGQMSLVGPRPEDPSFVEEWADAYDTILEVRPGVTGLSQIAFAKESEILDPEDSVGHYLTSILPQKVRMDQLYARRRSLLMDGRILVWTVAAVAVAARRRRAPRDRQAQHAPPPDEHPTDRELAAGRRAPAGGEPVAMASRTAANGNGSRSGRNGKTKAVVLAGGRGTRLAPYTSVLPKPLMPVGERAILELVVDQLESCGIKDITFCVGYLAHLIQSVFDNRDNGHVSIEYVHEHEALGTAGAAQARRRPRQHVPRDERRRADGARLPRPDPLPPGARQHAHDRDARAGDQGRLRDPPSRRHADEFATSRRSRRSRLR